MRYPQYKMQYDLKQNIIAESKSDPSIKSDTQLFRSLVKSLIEDSVWPVNNAESIIEKYPIIRACTG